MIQMKVKINLFVLILSTLLGCADKMGNEITIDNIDIDEGTELFNVTSIELPSDLREDREIIVSLENNFDSKVTTSNYYSLEKLVNSEWEKFTFTEEVEDVEIFIQPNEIKDISIFLVEYGEESEENNLIFEAGTYRVRKRYEIENNYEEELFIEFEIKESTQ